MENIIREIINQVEEELKRPNENTYLKIKELIFGLRIPTINRFLPIGMPFYRVRIHDENIVPMNNDLFFDIKEISHREDAENIKYYGRCNEPKQSLFYCATDRRLAYFETSSIIRNDKDKYVETYTIGKWVVKKPILVTLVLSPFLNYSRNYTASQLQEEFNKRNVNTEYNELWSYIADYFAKKSVNVPIDYFIPTSFANYVFEQKFLINDILMNISGVGYPSALVNEFDGFNFAFKPELIHSNLLLEEVCCQRIERIGVKGYQETETLIAKGINYQNRKIIWV